MSHFDDLTQQALGLGLDERARLAERLLESLDGLTEAEMARLWLDEADRRIEEYRAGTMTTIPADQVLGEVEDLLR